MRASARKGVGRRLRQAKRSAATRGWVKSSPEPVAADGPKRLSILRGFIFPAPSFVPYKTYETVPNLAQIRRKGQGLCPSCNQACTAARKAVPWGVSPLSQEFCNLLPFHALFRPVYIASMGWILFMQKRGLFQQLVPMTGSLL